MDISTCGQVKAGFHAVDLGVAYTKGTTFDDDGEAIVMPDFTYGKNFSRMETFISRTPYQHDQDKSPHENAQELPTPRPSSVVGDQPDLYTMTAEPKPSPPRATRNEISALQHNGVKAGVNTQDEEDLSRLKALVSLDSQCFYCASLMYPSNQLSRIRHMTLN